MKICLRPGHGFTPPYPLCYPKDSKQKSWSRQRPGGYALPDGTQWYEDDWVAKFCAFYLIPALESGGHCVSCQRACYSGSLDETQITVDKSILTQLPDGAPYWTGPRWQLCGAVESVLRGEVPSDETWSWSFDPQASAASERQKKYDLYLSVHVNWFNDPKMSGICMYHYTSSVNGKKYATNVYNSIAKNLSDDSWADSSLYEWGTPEKNKAIKEGSRWGIYTSGLYELKNTNAPAILIETGFSSNPVDLQRINDDTTQRKIAQGIVEGLG
jgi:hypothetical protein